jgi:ParB/RepB/Spo0J family partition protein
MEIIMDENKFSKTEKELASIADGNKETINDLHFVDPRYLVVELGHNVRNFEEQNVKDHIEWLKNDIKKNGVITPLLCRRQKKVGVYTDPKNNKEYGLWSWSVIDGECRLRAITELLDEGYEIKRVPVINERKDSSDADRALYMLKSNEGLAFTKYERAKLYNRFISYGWTKDEIAEKVSRSISHVNECLNLLAYSEDTQKMIVDKVIKPNNLVALEKQVKRDVKEGRIEEPVSRVKEVEKRLEEMRKRTEEMNENNNGRIIKVSKVINEKKSESEILAEQLDAVLKVIPQRISYSLEELKDLYDYLSAGHPIKNSVNMAFSSKDKTGTED